MATVTFASKLKEDGSLTIPREAVEELGLHPGDEIQLRVEATNRAEDLEGPDQAVLQAKFEQFFEDLDNLTTEKPTRDDHVTAPLVSPKGQSAHEALKPFLGKLNSGKGHLSQSTGEQFAEIVAENHRNQEFKG